VKNNFLENCSPDIPVRIVAIIDRQYDTDFIQSLPGRGASLVEFRADCFPGDFDTALSYLKEIKQTVRLPVIGTIRETDKNRQNRKTLFARMMPFVDAVDIEIDTPITSEVIALASDKSVIVSEHNYTETPDNAALETIIQKAGALGADVIKIAVMATCQEDVARLLCFTASRTENLVSISMGAWGTLSRFIAPLFGSLFTYAYIGEGAVAPGQLTLDEIVSEVKKYYPGNDQ
jgi:3-dehydroquinate dehydratase-1